MRFLKVNIYIYTVPEITEKKNIGGNYCGMADYPGTLMCDDLAKV